LEYFTSHVTFGHLKNVSANLFLRSVEILGNGVEIPQTAFSGFVGLQNSTVEDLATNGVENHAAPPTQAPISTTCGSQNSMIRDLNMNSIECQATAPAEEPAREPTLTELDSQGSAVGGSTLSIIDYQEPVQEPALTKCAQCLEKSRSCDGSNVNGKSCNACTEGKEMCSFRPYACEFCNKHFARLINLKGHITRFHKSNTRLREQLSLKVSKQSNSTGDARSSKRIRKDFGIQR
jgi:hypothetical protein